MASSGPTNNLGKAQPTWLPMNAKCGEVTCCTLWAWNLGCRFFRQSSGVGSCEARLSPINGWQVRDKRLTAYPLRYLFKAQPFLTENHVPDPSFMCRHPPHMLLCVFMPPCLAAPGPTHIGQLNWHCHALEFEVGCTRLRLHLSLQLPPVCWVFKAAGAVRPSTDGLGAIKTAVTLCRRLEGHGQR